MKNKIIGTSNGCCGCNNIANSKIKNVKTSRLGADASCSCSTITGETGATGAIGATGLSAYDVAVENGFIGTETQWLEGIVGATGPQIILGGLVPYSAEGAVLTCQINSNERYYQMSFLQFFGEYNDMDFSNFPTVFTIFEEGDFVQSFTTSKPTLITGLAFEIRGDVAVNTNDFVAKAFIFYSPTLDSNYYYVPESETILSPVLTEGANRVSGISSFEFIVPAKTKIVVAMAVDKLNPTIDDASCDFVGEIYGSMSIKEITE